MLEWQTIQTTAFKNAAGQITNVKLIHEFNTTLSNHYVDCLNRDIDLIAFQELDTEAEALNILEVNAVKIVEYDFDMGKVDKVLIP